MQDTEENVFLKVQRGDKLLTEEEVWVQEDYIRCQGSLAIQDITNPTLQLQQFCKEFCFLNRKYTSWNQVPIKTFRLSLKGKKEIWLADSLLELYIIHVTCEIRLEVPPCLSANKLKNHLFECSVTSSSEHSLGNINLFPVWWQKSCRVIREKAIQRHLHTFMNL